MKFYVTNTDYKPISDAHDTLQEAAEYALDHIANLRAARSAFVIGMDSPTFRTDLPAYICLRISAGSELERI